MIDPPRIANLLSAGQHNLNYFVVRKRRNKKCKKCKSEYDFIRAVNCRELRASSIISKGD